MLPSCFEIALEVIIGSSFKKDDYQQKLWHIGPGWAFRHKKISKPAKEIKEIKIEWKKRIKLYIRRKHTLKIETANIHEESINYDLLEAIKNEKNDCLERLSRLPEAVVYTMKFDMLE